MSESAFLLKSPRFDIDEEPGDSHSSSGQQWVGAFERVLGDRESLASERPSRPAAKQVPSSHPLIGARDARSLSTRPAGLEEPTNDLARSNAASRAGSSHSSSHGSPSLRGVPSSEASVTDTLRDQTQTSTHSEANYSGGTLTRFRTNSSSGSVSLVSLPPSSAASTQNASSNTSYGTSLHPHGKPAPVSLHIGPPQLRDTAELRVHSQGPECISVNVQDCLRFERSYINHAPCVHHIMVTNRSSDRCAVVRLESDLRQGLTFMRRKRSSPQNEFEPVAWPSNSFHWASNGGFIPANLRGWRHVLANLESADSFILDPQQTTKVYVVLRPTDFVEEAEALRSNGSWPYRMTASTSKQVISSKHTDLLASPIPHLPRPDDGIITSPVSTPAAFGDQQGTFSAAASDQDSSGSGTEDLGLTSPRSAPEMHASKMASRTQTARPLHPAFGLRGIITASSWLLPFLASEDDAAAESNTANGTKSTQPSASSSALASSRPASTYGSQAASTSAASSVISALRSQPEDRDVQKIRIPVAAQCCRPLIDAAVASVTPLDLNSSSTQTSSGSAIYLDFGDVIVGHSQSHTLTLRNLSEIDCFCQIKLEDADNMLQTPPVSLTDADTDETVPSVWAGDQESLSYNPLILGRLASKQIKVLLKPQEPCRDYEQVLTITSLHNTANSIRVVIRANMLGTAKDDALSVLSGDYLDFGDCYGGHWTKQLLVLKNNADVLLDVSFGVQQGYQVMFQLAELAPQAEDDTPDQEELPPNSHLSDISLSSASTDDHSRMSSAADSSSAGLDGASSAYDYSRQSDHGGEQAATASELAKTPTHHAHVPKGSAALEPPALELPAANNCEDLLRGRRGSANTDEDGWMHPPLRPRQVRDPTRRYVRSPILLRNHLPVPCPSLEQQSPRVLAWARRLISISWIASIPADRSRSSQQPATLTKRASPPTHTVRIRPDTCRGTPRTAVLPSRIAMTRRDRCDLSTRLCHRTAVPVFTRLPHPTLDLRAPQVGSSTATPPVQPSQVCATSSTHRAISSKSLCCGLVANTACSSLTALSASRGMRTSAAVVWSRRRSGSRSTTPARGLPTCEVVEVVKGGLWFATAELAPHSSRSLQR